MVRSSFSSSAITKLKNHLSFANAKTNLRNDKTVNPFKISLESNIHLGGGHHLEKVKGVHQIKQRDGLIKLAWI